MQKLLGSKSFYRLPFFLLCLCVFVGIGPAAALAGAPPTPVISAGGPTTFCQGGNVVLTATATGATSFQWYLNGTAISGATTAAYTASAAGNYTATATNAGGTSAASAATTVAINPNPVTPTVTAGGNTTFCAGGSVTLTANASGATSYQWSLNGTAISGATTATYTASAVGNYTVTVSNSNGCSSPSSASTSVTTLPAPAAPTIAASGPTTFCGSGSVILTANATGAASFQWYLNGAAIGGATANTYTASAAGSYTVIVANASGCSSPASTATTVTFNPTPAAPTITAGGATTFCTGGSVVLTAHATGATAYQWYLNGSSISGATNATYTASASGSYTVSIVGSGSCASPVSAPTTVSINPTPTTPTVTAGGNTPLCSGESVVLTANGSGATAYQWYLGGTAVAGATSSTYSAGASGNYTVTITDANGCSSAPSNTTSVTVEPVPTAPTVSAGGPTTFCSGGSVVLTASGTGATAYQWFLNGAQISGANSSTYTANASGNYTATYVNSNGCPSATSTAVTVTVATPPPPPTISAGGATSFCAPGSVVLTANATGATSYQWFVNGTPIAGATSQTFTATNSGNYTVSYVSACSSALSAGTTVTVYTPLTGAAIAAGGPTTFCEGNGVNLTTNSSNVASYQWYVNGSAITGAISASYFATAAGTYTVSISNPCSATPQTSAPLTVTVNPAPPSPTITKGGPITFCAPGSVVLTANPAGATAYQWFQDGIAITGATAQTYTATATGAYTVTSLNALGCSSTPSAEVDVIAYPPLTAPGVIASGVQTFCQGGSVTFTVTESGVTNYQWSLNGTAIPGANGASYVATASGSYTVFVSNPCSSATSGPAIVTVNPVPATPTVSASGSTTFCAGNSITLTASAAGATAYQWANNDTIIAGTTAQTFMTDSSGRYTVTVANSYGCTSTSAPVPVTVYPQLAPLNTSVSASGPTTFCEGGNVILTANASGAATYQWFLNGVSLTGGTTATWTATQSGTYTVLLSNPCSSVTSTPVTVTVNPAPATPGVTVNGTTTLCAGDSVILTANASGAASYQWFLAGAAIGGETTNADTVKASGSYTVTVTNANGCTSPVSAATVVTVNPLPAAPSVAAAGPTTFCSGSSVVLTASPAATSYQWLLNGAAITGATGSSYAGNLSGSYTVSLIDANGCTSAPSVSVPVTVNPNPPAPTVAITGATKFCQGDSAILSATATGTVTYQWLLNGTAIPNATTTTDTAKVSGSYTIAVTDGNGCTSTASSGVTVSVNPTPATPLTVAGGLTTFCNGDNVDLSASASGATSYQWYQNGAAISGATSNLYTATASGVYTVSVGDANNCSSDTAADISVTVNPTPAAPVITASGPLGICPGQTLDLTATPAGSTSYQWYQDGNAIPGATAQDYTATTSGTYTVTAENSFSCTSDLSTAAVVQNPCLPKADLSIVKTVSAGPYSVKKPVTYTLTVTNNGPNDAQNVVVSDTLPSGMGEAMNFGGNGGGNPVYNSVSQTIQWTLSTLPAGTTVTFTFDVLLKSFGTISNIGYVTSATLDLDTTNNHSTAVFVFAGDLFIPNVITPNGDGKNDLFNVIGLDRYPGSALHVYNRWGSQVYQSEDYRNTWDGSGLNAGTYYYVLTANTPTGKQTYKGWVEIIR